MKFNFNRDVNKLTNLKLFKLLTIFMFIIYSTPIFAQDLKVDSLKRMIAGMSEDTTKVDVLITLSRTLMGSSLVDAIHYGKKADSLANEINFKKGRALALKNIGLGYYQQSDYLNVFDYWEKSLIIFKEIGDQSGIANLESNLGSVYYNQGDDAKAVEYFLRSIKAAESIDDSWGIGRALIGIGNVYLNKKETSDRAKEYYWRALKIFEQLEYGDGIGTCAVNLGNIYLNNSEYDSALFYLEHSIEVFDNEVYIPHSLNMIGQVYSNMGDYQKAIEYLEKSIAIADQLSLQMRKAQALLGLATTFERQGKTRLALETYMAVEVISKEIGGNYELKDAYKGIANAFAKLGDFSNAFKYQEFYDSVKDTLYNSETDEKIKGMQFTYQIEKKQTEVDLLIKDKMLQDLEIQQQKYINYAAIIAGILLFIFAGGMFNRYRFIQRTKKIIEQEKDRSDKLLLNILPEETAEELKENGTAKARSYNNVTILFTDFKGFTELSATLSPPALVKEIHHCYMAFDEIMVRHKVEKIKTIGDAYMAAGGLPMANDSHPVDVTRAAIEIREFMDKLIKARKKAGKPHFEIRIGIHSGPVVAGVVGTHKFAYDIWGDTVNIASRMESNSEPGKINVSETTYDLIKDEFQCTPRGKIAVKGAGEKTMFFVEKAMNTQLV